MESLVLLETFTPTTDPLGHQWASALVALIPIVTMLVTLGLLRWKAHLAGLFSWALAFLVAIILFKMPILLGVSTSLQGFVYGVFPIVWILLGAIWMYQVTVISGRFDDLRLTFFRISDDRRVLGLLIAFCFGGLMEALAGFGAPVAIASVMLIAVGFSRLRAAVTALIADTVPVAFGAVGLPVLIAAKTAGLPVSAVAPIAGRITAIMCLFVPLMLLYVMDGRKGIRECWPAGLFIGIVFGIVKVIVSATSLYNLTEVFASVITVALTILFLKFWHPKGSESAIARVGVPLDATIETVPLPDNDQDASSLTPKRIFMALVPYLLVIVVFGVAAIGPVKTFLTGTDVKMPWPGLRGTLLSTAGKASAHQYYTFQWLSSPGSLLAIVAILVALIYRLPLSEAFRELGRNAWRMRFSALTIGSVVMIAYVMGDSGQTIALGLWVAGVGGVFPYFAPVLGFVGTYVTGSDTSANLLFSGLQASVGQQIGHTSLLVGGGAAGGVVGKMISPQSLTIGATAIELPGSESDILRKVLPWALAMIVIICIITGLMSTPVLGWVLP